MSVQLPQVTSFKLRQDLVLISGKELTFPVGPNINPAGKPPKTQYSLKITATKGLAPVPAPTVKGSQLVTPHYLAGDLRTVVQYRAQADTPTPLVFMYTTATGNRPIVVDAQSLKGNCKFKLALWGSQQAGNVREASLGGRIESGTCNGVAVHDGMVRASATLQNGQATLVKDLDVVVLN
jgi:hypothetical protein